MEANGAIHTVIEPFLICIPYIDLVSSFNLLLQELNELLSRATSIVRLSSELTNHSSSLFVSSLPYISEIYSAILRANELEESVMGVEQNGTTLVTNVKKERNLAMDAIRKANEIRREAKEMLYIVRFV